MKTTILILLGIATGWFIHAALTDASNGRDWRDPAKWAAWGLLDIAAVLYIAHLGGF